MLVALNAVNLATSSTDARIDTLLRPVMKAPESLLALAASPWANAHNDAQVRGWYSARHAERGWAMSILIAVVVITLSISAMCSLFEATLYSARLATLEAARASGRHRAQAAQMIQMKRDIAVPTSTILILNTLANTAGATIAGMYAAQLLGTRWVLLFSAALTAAILLLSEILPKTLGATNWKQIWPFIVWPLAALQRLLSPAVWFTRRFAALFTPRGSTPVVTEDEIVAMIRLGAKAGEVTPAETQLLNAIFHFDEVVCRQVMLPRREVVILQHGAPLSAWLEEATRSKHTRYPVCKGSLDDAVGLVHIKDLTGLFLDADFDAARVMRPLERVPETMPISRLLRQMQRSRRQMVATVDEHGSTVGIVTMELVLEQIVGPVQDEFDAEPPEIAPDGTDRFLVRGRVLIGAVNRELGLELYAREVDTVSGLLVHHLGRLPAVGDRVEFEGATAEVLEVVGDGRACLVRLTLAQQPEEADKQGDNRSTIS
jgi:CBS domain containing-hemolysin-like protein